MATQIQIKIAKETLMREMKAMRDRHFGDAGYNTFLNWGHQMLGRFKAKQLSERGPNSLGVVTGFLRRSFTWEVKGKQLAELVGTISTYAIYAPIHEFGGIIRPRTKPLLRWYSPEYGWRSAKEVRMPARMHLRDTVTREVEDLREQLKRAFEAKIAERGFSGNR